MKLYDVVSTCDETWGLIQQTVVLRLCYFYFGIIGVEQLSIEWLNGMLTTQGDRHQVLAPNYPTVCYHQYHYQSSLKLKTSQYCTSATNLSINHFDFQVSFSHIHLALMDKSNRKPSEPETTTVIATVLTQNCR